MQVFTKANFQIFFAIFILYHVLTNCDKENFKTASWNGEIVHIFSNDISSDSCRFSER